MPQLPFPLSFPLAEARALHLRALLCLALLLAPITPAALLAQQREELALPKATPPGSTIVLGFLGGWERWDDPNRAIRKLVLQLRAQQRPGLYAESCSNHNRDAARAALLEALDSNANGELEPEERENHRIILLGQSLGGGAVIRLAQELKQLHIPVALTVQVDSVSVRDGKIPSNVAAALNYYQHELLTIQGESHIEAEDPARTRILGNHRLRYPVWRPTRRPEGLLRRTFGGAHARMEADPDLWQQIRTAILTAAQRPSSTAITATSKSPVIE